MAERFRGPAARPSLDVRGSCRLLRACLRARPERGGQLRNATEREHVNARAFGRDSARLEGSLTWRGAWLRLRGCRDAALATCASGWCAGRHCFGYTGSWLVASRRGVHVFGGKLLAEAALGPADASLRRTQQSLEEHADGREQTGRDRARLSSLLVIAARDPRSLRLRLPRQRRRLTTITTSNRPGFQASSTASPAPPLLLHHLPEPADKDSTISQ